jgi:hypothetical protein
MSSGRVLKRSLLRLPTSEELEIVVVRRDDGTTIVRTVEELELEQARDERAIPMEEPNNV